MCPCEVQFVTKLVQNTCEEHKQGCFATSSWHCNCNPQDSCSIHTVPGILMAQCAIKKLTKSSSPLMMASGGISRALHTCLQLHASQTEW